MSHRCFSLTATQLGGNSVIGDRAFDVTVARTWNSLPPNVIYAVTVAANVSVTSRQFCSLEATPVALLAHENILFRRDSRLFTIRYDTIR